MIYNPTRALELLRLGTGLPSANFRDGQQEAIRYIVEGRGRLLVVQKTGWGKSFVYFIATKLLREAGRGPALLISPLLALLRNQIAAAERMGVRAATINSDNQNEWGDIETKLARNEIDILLISPERLENDRFRTRVLARIAGRTTLLVIDEAHCISEKTAMNREPHEPLRDCRLVLISPYDPRSGFNVGRAMQRNKLIYALADLALVVSSDLNKGGNLVRRSRTTGQAQTGSSLRAIGGGTFRRARRPSRQGRARLAGAGRRRSVQCGFHGIGTTHAGARPSGARRCRG
ncbi:DEAD/DEAH box helicase [Candidatus Methylocalor cossyra]|uniref:DNA 3'-5' helicase n=1 Tax=Candidatus Methylocalor cossyra TaxID=3108543 RepID=A0ABM9NKG3_9GAMM